MNSSWDYSSDSVDESLKHLFNDCIRVSSLESFKDFLRVSIKDYSKVFFSGFPLRFSTGLFVEFFQGFFSGILT